MDFFREVWHGLSIADFGPPRSSVRGMSELGVLQGSLRFWCFGDGVFCCAVWSCLTGIFALYSGSAGAG